MSEPISLYIDDFLAYTENQDLKEKTKRTRKNVLRDLEDYLENKDIYLQNHSRTKFKIKEFFDESNHSPHGYNISAVTEFFRYLRDYEDYERNEIRNCIQAVLTLKKTYDDTNALQRIESGKLDTEQKEKLIQACRESDHKPLQKEVMVRLIMEAGLSRSELLALKRKHIEFEETVNPASIEVVEKWDQDLGEERPKYDPRYVAVGLETRMKLKELIESGDRDMKDYVIWESPSYRTPQRWLNQLSASSGIGEEGEIKIKDLGRNAIVNLVKKDVRQHRIQEYVGSKSAVTEDIVRRYRIEGSSDYPLAKNKRIY